MTTLTAGLKDTISLQAQRALTVVGDAQAVARVWQLGATVGEQATTLTEVAASETKVIGPFATNTRFEIECLAGSVTFSDAPADFPTLAEMDARFQPILTNDVLDLVGAGVPVDYTDGTPPATGEGLAGPGSRYTDITNAKLYINGGTKAQPIWKIVTSA